MTQGRFELIVAGAEHDHAEDIDVATFNLLDEVTDVDGIDAAEAVLGPAPEGTRAAAEFVLATIVVTYYAYRNARYTIETIPQLAKTIRQWLDRNKDKRAIVRVTDNGTTEDIDLTDLDEGQIREVLERRTALEADKADVG